MSDETHTTHTASLLNRCNIALEEKLSPEERCFFEKQKEQALFRFELNGLDPTKALEHLENDELLQLWREELKSSSDKPPLEGKSP